MKLRIDQKKKEAFLQQFSVTAGDAFSVPFKSWKPYYCWRPSLQMLIAFARADLKIGADFTHKDIYKMLWLQWRNIRNRKTDYHWRCGRIDPKRPRSIAVIKEPKQQCGQCLAWVRHKAGLAHHMETNHKED